MDTTSLNAATLARQNRQFAGTRGISRNCAPLGLRPAFRDAETGETRLSRLPGGAPAPLHLIGGLPESWVVERDGCGRVTAVKASVVAGFLQGERFLTREQAARL